SKIQQSVEELTKSKADVEKGLMILEKRKGDLSSELERLQASFNNVGTAEKAMLTKVSPLEKQVKQLTAQKVKVESDVTLLTNRKNTLSDDMSKIQQSVEELTKS